MFYTMCGFEPICRFLSQSADFLPICGCQNKKVNTSTELLINLQISCLGPADSF